MDMRDDLINWGGTALGSLGKVMLRRRESIFNFFLRGSKALFFIPLHPFEGRLKFLVPILVSSLKIQIKVKLFYRFIVS